MNKTLQEILATKKETLPNQLFLPLAEQLNELVTCHNFHGQFLYASPICFDLLGYTVEEMTQLTMQEIFHPGDAVKVKRLRRALVNGAKKVAVFYRCKHKNGHFKYLHSTFVPIHNVAGEITHFITITKDIAQQNVLQDTYSQSESFFESLVESSDNIVALIGFNEQFLFANEKAQKLVNMKYAEIEGKTIVDLLSEDIANVYRPLLYAALNYGKRGSFESSISIKGHVYWLKNVVIPVRNNKGEIFAAMLNSVDISSIKRREIEIEQKNEQLSNIAFKVSHSLRAPLANIMGIINLLKITPDQASEKEMLQMMEAEAKKLDLVIHDIVKQATSNKVDK